MDIDAEILYNSDKYFLKYMSGDKDHRLKQLADALDLSVSKLEKSIGVGTSTLNRAIQRGSGISRGIVAAILEKYPNVRRQWLETGEGQIFDETEEVIEEYQSLSQGPFRDAFDLGAYNDDDPKELHRDKEYIDLGNGNYLVYVPLVPHIATMGYLSGYADPHWLEELPKHAITVSQIPRGLYRTFIARGQSMFDGTARSIFENSKVTGRVIRQDLYRASKLHLHKYQLYIIVHKDGITIKEITNHDVDKGVITLHSWNPDKKQYPDTEVSLTDVLQLLNVIKIERDI